MSVREKPDSGALMKRIRRARRASGLLEIDFAKKLNVPLRHAEIAEYGAFIFYGEKQEIPACELISEADFEEISQAIDREFGAVKEDEIEAGRDDPDECTIYFPMTVSHKSLASDLKQLLISIDPQRFPEVERKMAEREATAMLMMKFRAYCRRMQAQGNEGAAQKARDVMFELMEM